MNDYPMEVYKLFFKWFEANHLPTALLAKAHDGAAIVKMNAASEAYLAGYMQAKQEVDAVHEPSDFGGEGGEAFDLSGDLNEDEPDDLRLYQPDEAEECDDPDCPIHGMNWVDGFGYPKTIV
jgi:hypothetical protein